MTYVSNFCDQKGFTITKETDAVIKQIYPLHSAKQILSKDLIHHLSIDSNGIPFVSEQYQMTIIIDCNFHFVNFVMGEQGLNWLRYLPQDLKPHTAPSVV